MAYIDTRHKVFIYIFFYRYSSPNFIYQFSNPYTFLIQYDKKCINDYAKTYIELKFIDFSLSAMIKIVR